jgi:hypothetical protein
VGVELPWVNLTCEDGYQVLMTTRIPAPVEPADLAHATPSPSQQLGVVEIATHEDDADDGTPSEERLLERNLLCSIGARLLVSRDSAVTDALASLLVPDCEVLRATDQTGRSVDIFHPIAFAPVIDMTASRVLRRDDANRTIREVRDLVFDPAQGVGHHVVRDPRLPRHGVRYSPEAASLIQDLSGGAVCRCDVSWW